MLPAAFRISIKIFSLIFCLGFVFFYVMLGLRYDPGLKKIQTSNLYLNFNFWSKSDSIFFEQKKYFASNWHLVIYNQNQGCYQIEYNNQKKLLCWKNWQVLNQNIVTLNSIKLAQNFVCQKSQGIEFEQNLWDNILHFQRYKNIDFLFTSWSIFSCSWKNDCDFLTSYSWKLVCFTKKWIIINSWTNYLYSLE